MNILDAMDDPALFGPFFQGDTYHAWRTMLTAMCGLPMTAEQFATYQHHTGRTLAPTKPANEVALVCGRQSGKSRILATIAVFLAVIPDYSAMLAPGQTPGLAIIAADRRQAGVIFGYVRGLFASVDMLRPMVESEKAESLVLTNGVAIEVHTASFRTIRGRTLIAALCDEVCFWRTGDSANPDVEIMNALRPALGSLGGLLFIASSPYSKRGVLYDMWKEYFGKENSDDVIVWGAATLEMNPKFSQRVVAKAYEADPANAAAEYGGEWRSDIAAFVDRTVVDACIVPGRYELPKIPGCRYVAFTDPSGGSADSFTLAIAHPDPKDRTIAVLDAVRDAKPPFSPEGVVVEFATLLKTYGITTVTGDRYAGEWPREQFRKQNITYNLSEKPKSDLYRDALPLLNSGKVELLDIKMLTTQLCGLERRTARGGRDSIDHSPGAHDDVANSVAGALLLATTGRKPMNISQAAIENMGRRW